MIESTICGLASARTPQRRTSIAVQVNSQSDQQQLLAASEQQYQSWLSALAQETCSRTDHNHNEIVESFFPLSAVPASHWQGAGITAEPVSEEWFAESVEELDDCASYADEEGLQPPSEIAISRSRELLRKFSACITSRPDVYPMDEAGVAIDFRTSDGRNGLLFVVARDGSGAMFYCTEGARGRMRAGDASQLFGVDTVAIFGRVGIQ